MDPGSFYVRLFNNGKYNYYIQDRAGAFGSGCSITAGAAAKEMVCDARIAEADLYFQPIQIQANAPAGMCAYIMRRPYFYFNYKPGLTNVSVTVNNSNSTCSSGVYSNGNCAIAGVGTAHSDGTFTSVFDYTASGGPNCDPGTAYVTVIPSTGNPTYTTDKIGGKYSNCLAGPAIGGVTYGSGGGDTAWPIDSKSGYPMYLSNANATDGFNEVWKFKSIVALNRASSVSIANGYNYQYTFRGGARVHTSAANGYLPDAIAPASIGNTGGQAAYFWGCYDEAFELKYSISLFIHEFNTVPELTKWGTTSGATGATSADPDVTGTEDNGTTCGSLTDPSQSCNDRYDWDDFGTGYPQES